jgi:diadenosine tetraphosphate (Ap4A) HIT family hydrolase
MQLADSIYEHGALDLWSQCTFCDQFLFQRNRGVSGKVFGLDFEREIYQDPHFVVVAALGQIVPGWLLIIPRFHYPSIGHLPTNLQDRLSRIAKRIDLVLQELYGEPISFEHGSVSQEGTVGTCIEHAHLHVIPARFDIGSTLSATFSVCRFQV